MGNSQDPITLHKYLYANADPVNVIDPSGYIGVFGLAGNLSLRIVVSYPRVVSLVEIAASVATPLELAALSPVTFGLVGSGTVGLAAVRHLDKAHDLANSAFWLNKIHSGTEFEKFVSKLIGSKVNSRRLSEN